MDTKTKLHGYYESINKPGKALLANWDAISALGIDPADVYLLNCELIADGVLRRVNHPNTWGDSSIYLVK